MTNPELQKELEQLRQQVAELSKARAEQKSTKSAEEEEPKSTSESEESEAAFKHEIDELLKVLQDEVRDMPAVTALLVFALGILMGRFMR
jgi:F0F1-type ATP synthase membrane subunit b/b'